MTSKSCPVTSACTLWRVLLVGLSVAEVLVFGSRMTARKVTASSLSHAGSFVFRVCGKRDSTQPVYQKIKMEKVGWSGVGMQSPC